ncbi:MAG: hypothetical protein DUD27_08365 [Lachnospiraceae bacterium]|uniref:PilZ domain-containing protein n=1 Tax=Candidatus Weimeria bifida TaxID=2599074 RepID=A0A6N7IZC2_9FIRM|nr:hypothetical protein [Candidatus Weimeria bifida]RRF95100.1 MAG: hypothetical protein DUD27_08365 [Lachnospiraceae bacterium]
MLSERLKEGMEVILDYKTADAVKVYKTSVLVKEESLIALAPCTDDKGNFEEFKDGVVSLSLKGSNKIISDLRIVPVFYHGNRIYLTYGNRNENDESSFNRASARYPVNEDCKANDRDAKLLDVSTNGFGVIVNKKYKVGLWIELKYKNIRVNGKIMQSEKVGIETYFYGCKVSETSGPFDRFVAEKEEEFKDLIED